MLKSLHFAFSSFNNCTILSLILFLSIKIKRLHNVLPATTLTFASAFQLLTSWLQRRPVGHAVPVEGKAVVELLRPKCLHRTSELTLFLDPEQTVTLTELFRNADREWARIRVVSGGPRWGSVFRICGVS
jgi:hypothetical protein